jgi:hypothetical protein
MFLKPARESQEIKKKTTSVHYFNIFLNDIFIYY